MSSEILSDYIAIKNVIARYCEALDLKEFQLLHDVFMQNVTADYPFNSELKGVDAVIHAVEKRYLDFGYSLYSSNNRLTSQQLRTHPNPSQPHHTKNHFWGKN